MATVAQTLRLDGELGSRLIARAPHWVVMILVVLIGWQLAQLVAQLAGPQIDEAPPGVAATPLPTRSMVDIQSIVRASLFGRSAPDPTADAPVTSLSLHLAGTFAYPDEKQGFAILGNSNADTKFYKVGDALPGGVRLHAVHVDRVLLDRGGVIESLLPPPRTSVSMAPPPPMPGPTAVMSVGTVQDIIRENPGIIGQVIQRNMVLGADGRLQGIRVSPGANAQAFNRLGLRAGDLVTAINGLPLVDQASSNEVFNTLSSSPEARVTVMRNGVQQDLVLNLAEIAHEAEQLAEAPPPDAPPGPESAR